MVKNSTSLIPPERIENSILFLRGERVMLDIVLAELYEVPTGALVQAVKRNIDRFPKDFMFQLSKAEFENLRSQSVISRKHGGRRYTPYVFTEHGILMLSSVLRSKRAIQVNIEIMRAFMRMREMLSTQADLLRRLEALELRYDKQFKIVFDAIRQLMAENTKEKGEMGFRISSK